MITKVKKVNAGNLTKKAKKLMSIQFFRLSLGRNVYIP